MLQAGNEHVEDKASRIVTSRGLALAGLGISISLDELAIGFNIGLPAGPCIPPADLPLAARTPGARARPRRARSPPRTYLLRSAASEHDLHKI